jgi:hypothetical protein
MILTNNLPDHKLDHHYKLAFGLNAPMRAVAGKPGLKTQTTSRRHAWRASGGGVFALQLRCLQWVIVV